LRLATIDPKTPGYRQAMKNWVLPHLGAHKLQDLCATDLDKLYADLLRAGGVGGRPLSTVRVAASFLGGVERVEVPKTKRSRRTIDLDQRTASILKRHRATQREELFELGITTPTDDRVFTNEVGDPMRPHSVGQAFNRLVKSSGLPRIRLHDLRHTHASHLLAAGVNAKVVSERLGHSSVSFTLDTYGHVMPGQQSEAAEAAAMTTRRPKRRARISPRLTHSYAVVREMPRMRATSSTV